MAVRLKDPMGKGVSDHWIHLEESPRRVRAVFGGETIADSQRAILLREAGRLPVYYFPKEDVRTDRLVPTPDKSHCLHKGVALHWTVKVKDRMAEKAAWCYAEPLPECAELKDYYGFEWNKMDAWFEEDEEIFVHPRDPYKRVDVLQSSRHVRVLLDGEVVAETRRPRLLFETGHPTRYYLPPEDVRTGLFLPSSTITRCPFKGVASYWSVRVKDRIFQDVAWSYLDPIPECPKIRGLFCFFQERAPVIYVDGDRVPVPSTPWALVTSKDR